MEVVEVPVRVFNRLLPVEVPEYDLERGAGFAYKCNTSVNWNGRQSFSGWNATCESTTQI